MSFGLRLCFKRTGYVNEPTTTTTKHWSDKHYNIEKKIIEKKIVEKRNVATRLYDESGTFNGMGNNAGEIEER